MCKLNQLLKYIKTSLFLLGAILHGNFAYTQIASSTIENPVWYYIESAAINSLGSPNSTLTTLLPLKNKGYVLISPATAGKITYGISTANDTEKWAIVVIKNRKYLLNKSTGLYMTGSHSVGSFNANDSLKTASLGDSQFSIRTATTNSFTIAWNSQTCDRWSTASQNTNTAWIFKIATSNSPKEELAATIALANATKTTLTGDNPGYIKATSIASVNFSNAINEAQTIYNSALNDTEFANSKQKLLSEIEIFKTSTKNPISLSSPDKSTWYYIVNGSEAAYCKAKVIVNKSTDTGTALQFADKKVDPNMLWRIIDAGNGKVGIQNRASGKYISTTISAGTQNEIGAYNITSINSEGRFTINAGAGDLHPQNSGSVIVNWNEDGTFRSTWRLQEISETEAETPITVSDIHVEQGRLVTGIGNSNVELIYFTISTQGFVGKKTLESVKLNFDGTTNLANINNARIYQLNNTKFNVSTDSLLVTISLKSGDLNITLPQPFELKIGENTFCIVADIKSSATEGNIVDAAINSIKLQGDNEQTVTNPSPANAATIFLSQSILFSPGDYQSVSYRIPSIVTANDGSLVTHTDKRNNHSGDLAADIDQYVRRSTDNGKTWSDVLMTCGAETTLGYGDPAMVVDRATGKIICLVVHDKGFFSSTSTAPQRIIMLESNDHGISWSNPKDITDQLYGAGCSNVETKNWAGMFISSGRGLQLRNGRIMFAGVVRNGKTGNLQVHAVYTDNLGQTWNVSPVSAIDGGDESKFVERNNGDVLVSVRKAPKRYTNVSTDSGLTWGTASVHQQLTDPACNAEIMTYTSTKDGYNKNRLLHSLCYAGNRSNVSMLLSYDEGITFPIRKTICAGSSAYSTFTILNDGTIGMYFEDGSTGNVFDMVFVRFSLNWLTSGTDEYTAPNISKTPATNKKKVEAKIINGKIVVTGTDANFKIYNQEGKLVSNNNSLKPGMYVVKTDNEKIKVLYH